VLVLGVPVADNDDQAVALRALVRLAPPTGLVRGCPDRATALVGGPLDLEPALATRTPADRVIINRGVEAEVAALNLFTRFRERCADLVVR
jgi:hypothetical protein